MSLSRRQALLAGTALPLAAALPTSGAAEGHNTVAPGPVHSDFVLGDFRVTTLLAGDTPALCDRLRHTHIADGAIVRVARLAGVHDTRRGEHEQRDDRQRRRQHR